MFLYINLDINIFQDYARIVKNICKYILLYCQKSKTSKILVQRCLPSKVSLHQQSFEHKKTIIDVTKMYSSCLNALTNVQMTLRQTPESTKERHIGWKRNPVRILQEFEMAHHEA